MRLNSTILAAAAALSLMAAACGDDDGLTDPDELSQYGTDPTEADTDGDDYDDGLDAFPLDPAASLDSDKDGYPDQWNTGKTSDDSTTGLTLDDLPYDPSAHLDSDFDGFFQHEHLPSHRYSRALMSSSVTAS